MSTTITGYILTEEDVVLMNEAKTVNITRLNMRGLVSFIVTAREEDKDTVIVRDVVGYENMLDTVSELLGSIVLDIKPEWRELN